jgi:endogenous inhibitor of DNA gyrase (YacG/DUF329 family)
MGIIMIKCPVTGRDVSTGIETIGIEELPAVTAKMVCPACGRVHDWIKTNAWLADSGEQYRLGPTPASHSRTASISRQRSPAA